MSDHKSFNTIRPNNDNDAAYVKALYYAFGRNDAVVASFENDSHVLALLKVDEYEFAQAYERHCRTGSYIAIQDAFVMFQAGETEFKRD